jgi:hypothetical protein
MHDASTLMRVEMVDAAVGVDAVVEPSCHAAVQTCGFPSYSIACQTIFTTHNTCAVQTDDITILHTANNASHPDGKFGNFKLSEKETTCSTGKYKNAETVPSRRVNTEATNQTHCVTDSLLPSTEKVKMLSASTSACVEMLDTAVGVDTVAETSCPVAVRTCDVTSYRIACQTSATDKDTYVAQMDDVTMHHTADCISYPEDKLGNRKLLERKSTCSVAKKQNIQTKLCRIITTDAGVQTQCLSDNGVLNNCNLNSYRALIKDAEKERFCSVTSTQNVEIKPKNQGTMIRFDYEKPEKCLREELKKWQSLVAWLCSKKSDDSSDESLLIPDDSSVPAPTAQSRTNKLLIQQSTDKLLMKEIIPASSGLFAVEGTPFSSCYCKRIHPDEWLMSVVPCFQCHMSPVLFQPKLRNCELAMSSMAMPSKRCCHKNAVIGACPNMNHRCVSQTAHTHQELENCCCCLCVKTNHSNHKPHECEKVMQLSYMRSTSDKKSAKQAWKRNMDTEDSSDGWETGDNHKVPSRKIFCKRPRINSTFSTETDSEIENTGLRRKGICAEKQDSCTGIGPGRKVTRKQLRKRRKVAHTRSRYSQIGMNERKKYRTARSRKISTCLKEKHLRPGSSSDTQQHAITCSRFQKRKNKQNEDHKKDCRRCISEKMLDKNFPLPKMKHRSKHLMCGQLNEHTENSDTSVMKVCSEFHIDQSDIDSVKHFQAESCSTEIPTNLQSNAVQKTEAVPQEDKRKHLSCIELFGNVSDISLDEDQQSGRIGAQMQTVQPGNVSGSSSSRHKRRAQVESRTMDCASFEMQNSKRTKIGFVNKENNVSVTSEDYETVSNIMLHSVSESNPEKCNAKTCKTSTGISLASGEPMHLDQDCDISTANGSSLMLEHQVGPYKTRQAAGKTDVSHGVSPRRKPSKLEKLRRNLIRAKMPSKIATDLPIKCVEGRKKLTRRGETSCVGSESSRPGEKNISEIAREDEMLNSISTASNLSYRPLCQNIPALILENEKSPTKLDTTAHNVANWLVNNHDNSEFMCNSVTSQVCSSTYVTKEPDNETNHGVGVSKSFASKDNVPDAEIPGCSQDILPISSCVTETVSHVSISEIQANSSSTDRAPETVKVLALPISYKENMSEASQISESVELVTLPNTYVEASTRLETVTEVCSQNMSFETCQTAVDCKDVKSPATVLRIGELEESLPCPVSPIKDPVMGEPQLNSKAIEQLISTQDTIQVAELPVDGLSIDSPERLTGSSMHKQSDKQIAMKKSTVTKKTDEKLFAGCVLQWVLKDYEVEYKKKNLKKSKSMMGQLKDKG